MTAQVERSHGHVGLLWAVPVLCFLAIGLCWALSGARATRTPIGRRTGAFAKEACQ